MTTQDNNHNTPSIARGKDPQPGLIYIYNHTIARRKDFDVEIGWRVEVPKYRRVHKVQRSSTHHGGYEFEFVDEPGVIYITQYGWSLVQDTPAHIEALKAYDKSAAFVAHHQELMRSLLNTISLA